MNMEGFDNLDNLSVEHIHSIRDLRIGDEICMVPGECFDKETIQKHCFVVALFADKGTLGFEPEDHRGTIYGDFPDNPGDVLEFDLEKDHICKLIRVNLANVNINQLCG